MFIYIYLLGVIENMNTKNMNPVLILFESKLITQKIFFKYLFLMCYSQSLKYGAEGNAPYFMTLHYLKIKNPSVKPGFRVSINPGVSTIYSV